jgi:hypothetical protein
MLHGTALNGSILSAPYAFLLHYSASIVGKMSPLRMVLLGMALGMSARRIGEIHAERDTAQAGHAHCLPIHLYSTTARPELTVAVN